MRNLKAVLFGLACLAFAAAGPASAQVVINEIDYDQTGTDSTEFVELFNRGATPVDIGGWVIAFINGATDQFYAPVTTILAGTTLPAGGYYVLGSPTVVGTNQTFGATNQIQNGNPDAVGLYSSLGAIVAGAASDTNSGALIDGIIYGGPEAGNYPGYTQSTLVDGTTTSFGRSPNGTGPFAVLESPTPGAFNAAIVPEPTSLGLVAAALGGCAVVRRRRKA